MATEPVTIRRRWLGVMSARDTPFYHILHADVRFEDSDIRTSRVLLAGAGLLGVLWLIVVLLYFVFAFFAHYRAAASPQALPLTAERNYLPPAPRLQVSPRDDLKQWRAYENAQLHAYSWVDRKNGIVTIPIERAMQLLAERGIPAQKAPPDLKLSVPLAGTRMTGFEGKVRPEPR